MSVRCNDTIHSNARARVAALTASKSVGAHGDAPRASFLVLPVYLQGIPLYSQLKNKYPVQAELDRWCVAAQRRHLEQASQHNIGPGSTGAPQGTWSSQARHIPEQDDTLETRIQVRVEHIPPIGVHDSINGQEFSLARRKSAGPPESCLKAAPPSTTRAFPLGC